MCYSDKSCYLKVMMKVKVKQVTPVYVTLGIEKKLIFKDKSISMLVHGRL
jgi:hypothetical protein